MTVDRHGGIRRAVRAGALVVIAAALAAGGADRARAQGDFTAVEHEVLGAQASAAWRSAFRGDAGQLQDIGGTRVPGEFGAGRKRDPERPEANGTPNLGRKLAAGGLSLVLPGAGQYYNGKHERAYLMAGIEAGIWTAWFAFDHYGDGRMAASREWAGLYAGTTGDHADNYWQSVGMFTDSDAYNDSRYREARATGEDVSGLVGPGDAWQWDNEDRRYGYAILRAKGNSAYDRRDFMILFAVLNRAVSVFDAVVGAGRHDGNAQARVLGLDVELQVDPVAPDPYARCVVSRGF